MIQAYTAPSDENGDLSDPSNESDHFTSAFTSCEQKDYDNWITTLMKREHLNNMGYSNSSKLKEFIPYIQITPIPKRNSQHAALIRSVELSGPWDSEYRNYCSTINDCDFIYDVVDNCTNDRWECSIKFPSEINGNQFGYLLVSTNNETAYLDVTFANSKSKISKFSYDEAIESTLGISAGTSYLKVTQQSKIYVPSTEMFKNFLPDVKKCHAKNDTIWQPVVYSNEQDGNSRDGNLTFEIFFDQSEKIILISVQAAVPLDVTIGLVAAYLGFADMTIRLILYLSLLCQKFYYGKRNKGDDEETLLSSEPLDIFKE